MKKYIYIFIVSILFYNCKKVEFPSNPGNIMFYHEVEDKVVSVVYLPSCFSPNADGYNDLYRPVTNGMSVLFRMKIYNRNNVEIFHTTNRNGGWDGMVEGIKAAREEYQSELVLMDTTGYIYDIHSKVLLLN